MLKIVCALAFLGKSMGSAVSLPTTADGSPSVNPPTSSVGFTPDVQGVFDTSFMEFVEEGRHGRQLASCVSVQL